MKLFITTYEDYNNGNQMKKGKYYSLEDYLDIEELESELSEVYKDGAEYMITDFEGFPQEWYEESYRAENIEKLIEIANSDIDPENLDFLSLVSEYLPDSEVFENDEESLKMLCGDDTFKTACMVNFGDWNPTHDYVTLDGYGNLKSSENIEDLICVTTLIGNIYNEH